MTDSAEIARLKAEAAQAAAEAAAAKAQAAQAALDAALATQAGQSDQSKAVSQAAVPEAAAQQAAPTETPWLRAQQVRVRRVPSSSWQSASPRPESPFSSPISRAT